MKKINLIKNYFLTLSILVLGGVFAHAYPSADIVDALPGVYQGVSGRSRVPCEVKITKQYGQVEFSIKLLDDSNEAIKFESLSNRSLKRKYNEDFDFRKEQDRSFNPETANPWLIYYVNHGIPSIFGLYPRTDKLEVDWEKEQLDSVGISVTYSDGGPYQNPNDQRNQELSCYSLRK